MEEVQRVDGCSHMDWPQLPNPYNAPSPARVNCECSTNHCRPAWQWSAEARPSLAGMVVVQWAGVERVLRNTSPRLQHLTPASSTPPKHLSATKGVVQAQ